MVICQRWLFTQANTGYGGNGVALLPSFSPTWVTFAAYYGGIIAFPNVRGGSEFGQHWVDSGSAENLINSVYDFVSATCVRNYMISDASITYKL